VHEIELIIEISSGEGPFLKSETQKPSSWDWDSLVVDPNEQQALKTFQHGVHPLGRSLFETWRQDTR
jgi:hypothetical protein